MDNHEVRYREYKDGDMIQFGPNCLISVEKVRAVVVQNGGIVAKNFNQWIEDLKNAAKE